MLNLLPDPVKRVAKLRGIAIDFDKDAEVSFHAPDLENREPELVWTMLESTSPAVPSADPSLRIAARRGLARRSLRRGTVGDQMLFRTRPSTCHRGRTDQTARSRPGRAAEWLLLLSDHGRASSERSLAARRRRRVDLRAADHPAAAGGPPDGATGHATRPDRRNGRRRLMPPRRRMAARPTARLGCFLTIFAAISPPPRPDLDALEKETADFDKRLSILSMRAMIRWAQGDPDRARQIIAYLVSNTGTATEHSRGYAAWAGHQQGGKPGEAWAAFLSLRVGQ